MTGIKAVLLQTSMPRETKDYPPTYTDVQMRMKHAEESVEYNLKHAQDHLKELCSQLSKLSQVDRNKAEELAHKVCKELDRVYKDVEEYKGHPDDHKE